MVKGSPGVPRFPCGEAGQGAEVMRGDLRLKENQRLGHGCRSRWRLGRGRMRKPWRGAQRDGCATSSVMEPGRHDGAVAVPHAIPRQLVARPWVLSVPCHGDEDGLGRGRLGRCGVAAQCGLASTCGCLPRTYLIKVRHAVEVITKVASWLSTRSVLGSQGSAADRETCERRERRRSAVAVDGRRMARLGIGTGFIARRPGFGVRGVSDARRRRSLAVAPVGTCRCHQPKSTI